MHTQIQENVILKSALAHCENLTEFNLGQEAFNRGDSLSNRVAYSPDFLEGYAYAMGHKARTTYMLNTDSIPHFE